MSSMKEQLQAVVKTSRAAAQARLNERRYIVRVIDARDDWTKCVTKHTDVLTASKRLAQRFTRLGEAVRVRNYLNKQDHVKSAWIIFE